jgi:hypothetical protein
MATRLVRDGGLFFIKGSSDPPVKKKWWDKMPRGLGLVVVLALLVTAVLWLSLVVAWWPTVLHALKGLVVHAA